MNIVLFHLQNCDHILFRSVWDSITTFFTVLLMTGDMDSIETKGGGRVCRAAAELVVPSGQPLCKQTWS